MKFLAFLALIMCNSLVCKEIRRIILVSNSEDISTANDQTTEAVISTRGVDLPGSPEALEKFLGDALRKGSTQAIKTRIYSYYEKNGRPFVVVSIPSQEMQDGVLQVVIEESRLGNVSVEGERYTSPTLLKKYVSSEIGKPISTESLSKDVSFMNRNPFRRVNAFYTPGKEAMTTDLILEVEDRNRFRLSAGIDNNGIPTIGRNRVFANISFNQFFGFDHFLFYQYTTNYEPHRFQAHTLQYTALLPNKTSLSLYGGYSVVHATLSGPQRSNQGTNGQGSLRYEIPLTSGYFISQDLVFGIDVKNTNNTLEYTDLSPVFGQTVNMSQALFGYRVGYEWENHRLQGGVDAIFSPFAWLPNQTKQDFASLRPGAQNIYAYFRLFATQEGPLPKRFPKRFSYFLFFQGQVSGQTLLPSEQLGLGGYGSVRGYDPRQFNMDTGMLGNFELRWDVLSFWKKGKDLLQMLVFVDGGGGLENTVVPGIPKRNFLIGAGPGLRYSLFPYLQARADWGFKLHHQAGFTGGWNMLQFSISGNY